MESRSEYKRRWYAENKDKMKEYHKNYRRENKAAKKDQDKAYYEANKIIISKKRKTKYVLNNDFRESIIKKCKDNYTNDKETILKRNKGRFDKARDKIKKIALHYGCQCQECKWKGEFDSSQLHFHHKNATTKQYNVSSMGGLSLKRIAEEINKCCVLCACCHAIVTKGLVKIPDNIMCDVDERLSW